MDGDVRCALINIENQGENESIAVCMNKDEAIW